MSSTEQDSDLGAIRRTLEGMLALQIADRPDGGSRPTELVLSDAGFSLAEISHVTGRKYESVKTTIRRARKASTAGGPNGG